MLTGQDAVMTESQLEVLQFSLAQISFLGVLENRPQCPDQVLKLNTSH